MLWGGIFNVDTKRESIKEKEELTQKSDFWDDSKAAQVILKYISKIKFWVK